MLQNGRVWIFAFIVSGVGLILSVCGGVRPQTEGPMDQDGSLPTDVQEAKDPPGGDSTVGEGGLAQDGSPPASCLRLIPKKPSLGRTFEQVFRRTIHPSVSIVNSSVALGARRLAITGANHLWVLEPDGREVADVVAPSLQRLSPPVSDGASRFFAVGASVLAVDDDGKTLWQRSVPNSDLHQVSSAPLLTPSGVLVNVQATGSAFAINMATGAPLWSATFSNAIRATAGFGESFVILKRGKVGDTVPVVSVATGATQFELQAENGGWAFPVAVVAGYGIVRADGGQGGLGAAVVHDFDGKRRWQLPAPHRPEHIFGPRFLDLGGRLNVIDNEAGPAKDQWALRRFDCDGREESSIVLPFDRSTFPVQFLVAGDGRTYVLAVKDRARGFDGVAVYVFNEAWQEEARKEFPDTAISFAGAMSPVVLSPEGMLYIVLDRPFMPGNSNPLGDIIGLQTGSPGLAETAWSTSRNDAAARGWTK